MEVDGEEGLESAQEPQNDSDSETEMSISNNRKSRSNFKIIDSDSDSEVTNQPDHESEVSKQVYESENDEEPAPKDDKESDRTDRATVQSGEEGRNKKKPKRIAVVDSDSDDEDLCTPPTPHNKSFNDDLILPELAEAVVYNVNQRGELVPEESKTVAEEALPYKSRISALIDSESSDDERAPVSYSESDKKSNVSKSKTSCVKKTKKTTKVKEPKPMTGKQAVELRKEIQSESQRMIRESKVSLPYHRPKSYSLKEFLEKRSKLASALPPCSIKMSKDQLEVISKKLNERSKEVEEFYKSDSESSEEENQEEQTSVDILFDIRNWLDALADNAVDKVENCKITPVVPTIDEIAAKYDNVDDNAMEIETESVLPSAEYEFNLDDIEEERDDSKKRVSIFDLLKDKLANTQPRLSGGPDDVIDLDEGVTKPNERKRFVEKFIQNTTMKPQHKHKVQLNVVSLSRGEIHEETVTMNLDDEDESAGPLHEIPGAKMQKLREGLQNQMALKRSELWEKRKNDLICPEKEGYQENAVDGDQSDPDFLDDEEEEAVEMTESSEEEEEEDYEEYENNLKKEKPKVKSAFVEDEAEVSDNEEDYEGDEDDEDVDNYELKLNTSDELNQRKSKKKVLKRIIKGFNEESDDEEDSKNKDENPNDIQRERLDSTASCEDEMLPPNLPRETVTPQRFERNMSDVDFLTPVTYLTGLQNLNSGSKFLKESPVLSPFRIPTDPSFLIDDDRKSQSQKKLFEDNVDSTQTQNMDDLSMLCSGKFPSTQEYNDQKKTNEREKIDATPSTQELLEICSGNFTGIEKKSSNDTIDTTSPQTIIKVPDVIIPLKCRDDHRADEIKNLDEEQDQLISQLLNDDELEQFKKKFESPIIGTNNANTLALKIPTTPAAANVSEVNATGVIMSDDDDDNDDLEVGKKLKKKKKLTFSDDEDSDDSDSERRSEEEEIDLHDDGDDYGSEHSLKNPEDVAYDSEENEIDDSKAATFKIANFVENEAELSESEWGSADEDERDLDQMDDEKGDEEVFDEDKVRSDLEKIHMRKLLDDDTRQVKLLQELLLEDGEMHGSGRQRQFKWRNIDTANFGEDGKTDADDDMYLDEEESEEQFRKKRHQREMFLKQKAESDDVASILSDSQVLKVGQKIITKSLSLPSQSAPALPKDQDEFKVKQPFGILSKRGSFLSRKDQVLERLAEYTKVTHTESVGSTAKNGRSFIFKSVSSTLETTTIRENKRKAEEGTPIALKKLRLADLSPMVTKKSESKPGSAKSLFPDW